jgi:hypothetical protein
MKKELFSFKNLLKFILIILFLLSISFVVEYNIKEYDKQNKNETNVVKESFIFLKDLNATEVENSSSFEAQTDINNEIIKKLNEEIYTIDSPLIVTNPYKINPLSAIIAFNTKENKSINVVINGEYSYTSSESKIHILPVYYLYGDTTNKISLNGIEIDIDINIETDTIYNNTNNLLFIDRDNLLNAFKNEKQVMSLSVELDDYLIENNSNFLIKNDDVLFTITPYGLITSMYYFNSNIIDYIEDTNNIYVLLDNSLIKINKYCVALFMIFNFFDWNKFLANNTAK